MNHSGDAAEQIVRMSLEGVEVAAKITGNAAKEIALLLMAAMKSPDKGGSGNMKLKGKERMATMLKSGKAFIKSYCAVCLEGAIIVLACVIFSVFASSPPVVDPDAAAVTQVWTYVGELIFNMLVLVGTVKMADRICREVLGL